MNKIIIGIMCFGDERYFYQTEHKITNLKDKGISCYVLTDNPLFFNQLKVTTIYYGRNLKSYHDKIILVKNILNDSDICVLIDADTIVTDYSMFDDLLNYNFEKGISYIDTLKSHRCGYEFISNIQMNPENIDWYNYRKYVEKIYPQYNDLETIYEYLIVFNKDGLNEEFFKIYEQLQALKEACELLSKEREVHGAGEGVTIHISAKATNSQIQRDKNLYNILNNKIINKTSR